VLLVLGVPTTLAAPKTYGIEVCENCTTTKAPGRK
jgi:hypothetical protein